MQIKPRVANWDTGQAQRPENHILDCYKYQKTALYYQKGKRSQKRWDINESVGTISSWEVT